MNCFDEHAALGHHPCGNRAVDAAGKQGQALAVGAQRQSAEAGNLTFVDICAVASYVNVKQHIRLVYIHFENLAAYQDFGTDDAAQIR